MIKRFTLLCLVIAVVTAVCVAAQKPRKCKQLKKGTFKIFNELTGKYALVKRTAKLQVEVTEGTTDSVQMSVRWTGDCEYELLYLSDNFGLVPDEHKEFARTTPLQVKILTVNKDYYIYTSKMPGIDFVLEDTAYIVR